MKHSNKILCAVLVAAVMLFLVSCGAKPAEDIVLQGPFADMYGADQKLVNKYASIVDDVSVETTASDGTKLTVVQTLADSRCINIYFTITPSDGRSVKWELPVLFKEKITYEDAEGMDLEQLRESHSWVGNGEMSLSGNLLDGSDIWSYSCSLKDVDLSADVLTLAVPCENGEIYFASWTPKNSGESYEFKLEDGDKYANIKLGVFGMDIYYWNEQKDMTSLSATEAEEMISIITKDGSLLEGWRTEDGNLLEGWRVVETTGSGNGKSICIEPVGILLDIESIAAVEIDGLRVDINI